MMSKPIAAYIVPTPEEPTDIALYIFIVGIIWYLFYFFEFPTQHFQTNPSLFFSWIYHYTLYKPILFLLNCIVGAWSLFIGITTHSNLNTFFAIIFTALVIFVELIIICISGVVLLWFYLGLAAFWVITCFVLFLFN